MKFKTSMLKSILCAYKRIAAAKGNTNNTAKKVVLKKTGLHLLIV